MVTSIPASGVFIRGTPGRNDRIVEPFGQFSGGIAPPYEPGAVPVFEHGGQKGPIASPVSDNRTDVQANQDPMKGQKDAALDAPVQKVHYGEIVTEPTSSHNTLPPSALGKKPTPPEGPKSNEPPRKDDAFQPDGDPKPGLQDDGLTDKPTLTGSTRSPDRKN